ncbi:MAG: phytanoyl-CoA dioxygenase family protein [Vicinamibacterales bacterium]
MSAVLQRGFTVLPSVFTQQEIASLREAIADSIDRVARVMLTPFASSLPSVPIEERLERVAREDRAYASALLQVVMADAQRDPRLAAVAVHPVLSDAIGALLVPDTPTGHVIRTRAAIPAFTSRISPWHQDVPRPQSATACATVRVACWIPLSDVDEHSGALEVIPGSWEAPCPHEAGDDGHFGIPEHGLPSGERRVVPMRAGDVLLLDRFIPHRARPTRGLQGRWSVVMWVKAGGASSSC